MVALFSLVGFLAAEQAAGIRKKGAANVSNLDRLHEQLTRSYEKTAEGLSQWLSGIARSNEVAALMKSNPEIKLDFGDEQGASWHVVVKNRGATGNERSRLPSMRRTTPTIYFEHGLADSEIRYDLLNSAELLRFVEQYPVIAQGLSENAVWNELVKTAATNVDDKSSDKGGAQGSDENSYDIYLHGPAAAISHSVETHRQDTESAYRKVLDVVQSPGFTQDLGDHVQLIDTRERHESATIDENEPSIVIYYHAKKSPDFFFLRGLYAKVQPDYYDYSSIRYFNLNRERERLAFAKEFPRVFQNLPFTASRLLERHLRQKLPQPNSDDRKTELVRAFTLLGEPDLAEKLDKLAAEDPAIAAEEGHLRELVNRARRKTERALLRLNHPAILQLFRHDGSDKELYRDEERSVHITIANDVPSLRIVRADGSAWRITYPLESKHVVSQLEGFGGIEPEWFDALAGRELHRKAPRRPEVIELESENPKEFGE